MNLPHQVIIRHGDLNPRIEKCSLRGCIVGEDGLTSCDHLACPCCGVGPPVDLKAAAYCEQCGYTWLP